MKINLSLVLIMFVFCNYLNAQNNEHTEHLHEHHRNEIGIGISPVYFLNEKEFALQVHTHYTYNIKDSKFGIGVAYERIFDEHKHNTIGIVGSYRPFDKFTLSLSPGITFTDTEISDFKFALHIETLYEFEINDFHIGPLLEFAYDPDDYHISFGIHAGFGF